MQNSRRYEWLSNGEFCAFLLTQTSSKSTSLSCVFLVCDKKITLNLPYHLFFHDPDHREKYSRDKVILFDEISKTVCSPSQIWRKKYVVYFRNLVSVPVLVFLATNKTVGTCADSSEAVGTMKRTLSDDTLTNDTNAPTTTAGVPNLRALEQSVIETLKQIMSAKNPDLQTLIGKILELVRPTVSIPPHLVPMLDLLPAFLKYHTSESDLEVTFMVIAEFIKYARSSTRDIGTDIANPKAVYPANEAELIKIVTEANTNGTWTWKNRR